MRSREERPPEITNASFGVISNLMNAPSFFARRSLEQIEVSERALRDADTTAELEAARADKLEKEAIALKREYSEGRRRSSERVDLSERALQEADKTAELEAARADELEKRVHGLERIVEEKNSTYKFIQKFIQKKKTIKKILDSSKLPTDIIVKIINAAYGKLGATQVEIDKATRLANAHDFIISSQIMYRRSWARRLLVSIN